MPSPKIPNKLSEFKSNFHGYVKPSLYEVAFMGRGYQAALGLMEGTPTEVRDILMLCEQARFPGSAVSTQPNRVYGPVRELAYERIYSGDLSLTFRMDKDMLLRTFFSTWQEVITSKITGDFGYYDDYKADCEIYAYPNKQAFSGSNTLFGSIVKGLRIKNPIYGLRIKEMYPKSIAEIELGYEQRDTYMKQTVEFAFRSWEEIPADEY